LPRVILQYFAKKRYKFVSKEYFTVGEIQMIIDISESGINDEDAYPLPIYPLLQTPCGHE